jgi:hypothetical protein
MQTQYRSFIIAVDCIDDDNQHVKNCIIKDAPNFPEVT